MPNRRTVRPAVAPAVVAAKPDDARRLLLADWCRLVGRRLHGDETPVGDMDRAAVRSGDATRDAIAALRLPPRMGQTLTGLLAGRSEKQIALDLGLSPHTIHTYIKQLHKRMNVSSRGELLARFVTDDVRGGRFRPDTTAVEAPSPD